MAEHIGPAGDDVLDQQALGLADWTTIKGGAGDDRITIGVGSAVGGPGNDTIIGTDAVSTALYWDAHPVKVNLAEGWAQDGHGGTDMLLNIRSVHLSGSDDTLVGSSGNAVTHQLKC